MFYSVVLAYNSTSTIPSAGAQRITINVAYANGSHTTIDSERYTTADRQAKRRVYGSRKRLLLTFGRAFMSSSSNRAFLRSFLSARFRWAVYGSFNDSANSGNQNLCQCEPTEDDIELTVSNDAGNPMELLSVKLFQ